MEIELQFLYKSYLIHQSHSAYVNLVRNLNSQPHVEISLITFNHTIYVFDSGDSLPSSKEIDILGE